MIHHNRQSIACEGCQKNNGTCQTSIAQISTPHEVSLENLLDRSWFSEMALKIQYSPIARHVFCKLSDSFSNTTINNIPVDTKQRSNQQIKAQQPMPCKTELQWSSAVQPTCRTFPLLRSQAVSWKAKCVAIVLGTRACQADPSPSEHPLEQ